MSCCRNTRALAEWALAGRRRSRMTCRMYFCAASVSMLRCAGNRMSCARLLAGVMPRSNVTCKRPCWQKKMADVALKAPLPAAAGLMPISLCTDLTTDLMLTSRARPALRHPRRTSVKATRHLP
ncbi:hypothetical protein KCP70_04865 [Salmonella enterica subsp. enterica]|nr:hypothetical protein KCP70_04865 [Salmonella enterica subsp. enterica]